MTFSVILKAIEKQYKFSCCYIAKNMNVDDEIVDLWEEDKAFPNDEQIRKFCDLFALPYKTVKDSVVEGMNNK